MEQSQRTFWKKYIANSKVDLLIATYTKVPKSWSDFDYTPDFNKLYYIIEGEGYIQVKDQMFYPKPGELYILPSGVKQSYGTVSDNTFGKYWCNFKSRIGDHNLFELLETPVFVKARNGEALKHKFEQLIHYSHSEELTSDIRVTSILLELIAEFIEQCDTVKLNMTVAPSFEKMSMVLKYIEDHLDKNFSVDELAQIAHFHPNYFINVFKQFTSYSPIQYINRMRLEKAKHLLTMTDLSVTHMAEILGMELSYFSRMFREHTGFTPTAYREMVPKQNTGIIKANED